MSRDMFARGAVRAANWIGGKKAGMYDRITSYNVCYTKLLRLYYRCTPLTLALKPNGSECTEARWVAADEIAALSLPPGTRHILGKLYPDQLGSSEAPPARTLDAELPGGIDPSHA